MRTRGTGLGDELTRIMRRIDRSGKGLLQVRVAEAWETVAGPSAAAHTTGAHVRGGELMVYVDSPVWATELSALAALYRQEINKYLGQEVVETVRFSVSRKAAEKTAQSPKGVDRGEGDEADPRVASIPLSQGERRQVEASVAAIKDEALRETVLRATIADLEWKKGLAAAKSRQDGREGP